MMITVAVKALLDVCYYGASSSKTLVKASMQVVLQIGSSLVRADCCSQPKIPAGQFHRAEGYNDSLTLSEEDDAGHQPELY